jgi:hypothetical protein
VLKNGLTSFGFVMMASLGAACAYRSEGVFAGSIAVAG